MQDTFNVLRSERPPACRVAWLAMPWERVSMALQLHGILNRPAPQIVRLVDRPEPVGKFPTGF